ncbi:hypothetical protein [Sphingomonas panni]|uniref:hypothetical protein n=1 Tax=Sphingomonas panni TaxID=237612 RepID=UPI001F5B5A8F|nr:hypothetical protein [Sphingomonas panni]
MGRDRRPPLANDKLTDSGQWPLFEPYYTVSAMVPAGYLLKRIVPPPGWLDTASGHIKDICSVSDCVNDNVVDVQDAWLHNGFGLANSPDVLTGLASASGMATAGATLMYFTAYEYELKSDGWRFDAAGWRPRSRIPSAVVADDVRSPDADSVALLGYDVVVCNDYLEHSPLSCNVLTKILPVNEHCLLPGIGDAIAAVETGKFGGGCEEGKYTIYAVHLIL